MIASTRSVIRFAVIVLVFIVSLPLGASDITVAENPVPATSFADVTIKLAPKQSVSWSVYPKPTKMVEDNGTLYFNGPPNVYEVTASVFWIEGDIVKIKKVTQSITLGKPGPTPPPPTPAPSEFDQAVQTAFDKETSPDKAVHVAKLASLYRVAADSTVKDPLIKTYGQLFDTMKAASLKLLPETAIPHVRRVVGDRLNPLAAAASTPVDRDKLAAEFKAVADALSKVK